MTRAEHLRRAKSRALAFADRGDVANAIASLRLDLDDHPETAGHEGIMSMTLLAMDGHLDGPGELRNFIEGFS
jgi:hypothetical protein